MHRYTTTLKLPRLEDSSPQKSPSYYNAPKHMLPSISGPIKTHPRPQKMLPAGDIEVDHSFSDTKKGPSTEKNSSYTGQAFFGNSSLKQDWILKKLEAQREVLENKPHFNLAFENHQADMHRQGFKGAAHDRVHDSMNPKFRDSPAGGLDTETTPKSVNLNNLRVGRTGRFNSLSPFEAGNNARKKPELEIDNVNTESLAGAMSNQRGEMSVGAKGTASKYGQIRFPSLNPIDETKYDAEGDKGNKKVNIELILSIEEKLRAVYENPDNRQNMTARLKEYIELVDTEEPIHVESLFFDTRARRNLKGYLMLEKTSVFTLLFLISEDGPSKEAQQTNIRNICHYMYSNFINFAETVATKLDLLPRFSQMPNLEKLKQIAKRRPQEIDRSFNTEQVTKLLLRVLRTSLKQSAKKGDRSSKIDMLLEKIEFGLMTNYNSELKSIFRDLILKHKINVVTNTTQSSGFGSVAGRDRFGKVEKKPTLGSTNSKLTPLNNPLKGGAVVQKEAYLPPPIPKQGQENRPVYTLVLDMDETLIHFEEIGGRGRFFVRPYADKFLKEMSELYEIVVFTAGAQDYADKVLNILDPNGYIDHRLYRQHVTLNHHTPGVAKELTKLGRDLTKTIIIDNVAENFRLQPDNGIEIVSWYNNPYDTELLTLTPFLTELVLNQVEDVTKSVKKYKEKLRKVKHF